MCGIAGIIARSEQAVRAALGPMVAAQKHRGPDDSGSSIVRFGERFLGLGHRRLSILDLSAAGHQPMTHPVNGDQIVFNGEIYNFRELRHELEAKGEKFTGHSDTEVLLHALSVWGPDALRRLQGMYAFAFYSARNNSLMLGRDPLGIKPLYIAQVAGAILFASELRAILASGQVPRKLDLRGVAGLLAYGAVQQPCTMVKHVSLFPPGCYQFFDAVGDRTVHKPHTFWSYPEPQEDLDEARSLQSIRVALDAAVRDHLVADVPVGVFLSSGLDSTVIAGLASRHTPRLRSFTVGFPDPATRRDATELELAAQTAKLFNLEHTLIQITPEDAERGAADWMQSLDQPSIDGLNVYLISKAVRGHGIKVALSGQGGDELFGGYPSFRDVPKMRRLMRRLRMVPAPLRVALASASALGKPRFYREKIRDVARTDGSLPELYLQRRRAMSSPQLAMLGLEAGDLELSPNFLPPDQLNGLAGGEVDPVWGISQLESRFYQGNMLLRDSDANGMSHGLEIRVPLLDQRVVDFMLRVPGRVRLPSGINDKHLLRSGFPDLLRAELLREEKRGFALPIARWMLQPLRSMCHEGLEHLKSLSILRGEGIDRVWSTFLSQPYTPIWSRAFVLCVLGTYAKRNSLTA